MFNVVDVTVNDSRFAYNKQYIQHYGNIYYGYIINKYECLYGENLISKNNEGTIKFEDLPKNLKTLRNVSLDLVNEFSDLVMRYRYNEFKGTLNIILENYSFGNEDNINLFVSNAAFYDDSVKDTISTLNNPKNKLISDIIVNIKDDYDLIKKINKNTNDSFTFSKIAKIYAIYVKITHSSQLGDQRIQNLIDNRLYSKYFITEPLK